MISKFSSSSVLLTSNINVTCYSFFLLGVHPLEKTLLYPEEALTVRLVLVVLGKGHRDALRNALFDGGKHTILVSWEGLMVGLQLGLPLCLRLC